MNERVTLRPGALVVGRDGGLGSLDGVVVRPDSREVLGLLLREGLLVDRRIVVPLAAVREADDSRVYVALDRADLNELYAARLPRTPDALLTDVRVTGDTTKATAIVGGAGIVGTGGRLEPAGVVSTDGDRAAESAPASATAVMTAGAEPAPPTHVLRAGQTVVCRNGETSPLVLVLVDAPTARITGLVVQPGGPAGRPVIVPAEWAIDISAEPIVLSEACERLDSLPEFRSDEEITDAVSGLLWYRSDLARADLQFVTVRTRDGVVELDGKTRTERARQEIEGLTREVRGVLGVRNGLRTFEALDAAVRRFGDESIGERA